MNNNNPIRNSEKEVKKKKLTIVIVIVVVILVFLISILINVIGIAQTFNPNVTDKSGLTIGFSVSSSSTKNEQEDNTQAIQKIEEKSILTNSIVLINLKNNNWNRINAGFKNFEIDEDGNCIFEDGYTLYCNKTNVQYVIFNENYTSDIIGNIKVGTPFENIKSALGTPTFEEDNMIGYKTGELYIFFYEDENEVVVYPNGNVANGNFETLIFQYYDGLYSGNRTNFVVELKNNYIDFTAEMDENDVILTSVKRQIQLRLPEDGSMQITIYNGYNKQDLMASHLSDENIIQENDDLVKLEEAERANV
jgi:hypothetical protein